MSTVGIPRFLLRRWYTKRMIRWLAIVMLIVTGLIHLALTPEHFGMATYLGLLFLANTAAAGVAAVGIKRNLLVTWLLGFFVCAASLIIYVVVRTVGLPGITESVWFEPLGVLSIVAEAAFLVLFGLSVKPKGKVPQPSQARVRSARPFKESRH